MTDKISETEITDDVIKDMDVLNNVLKSLQTVITDDVIKGLTLLQAYEIAKQISELVPGTTPEFIWDMLF